MRKLMMTTTLLIALLLVSGSNGWTAITYTSATGNLLYIPCINIPGVGAFEVDLRTGFTNMELKANLEFELQ